MASDSPLEPRASHSRLAERVQMAANIAVILACVGVGWMAWLRMHQRGPEPPPAYKVGERVDAIAGIDFGASSQTLLMVLREDCRYCRDSLPFYKSLTAAVGKTADKNPRLVVASTDRPDKMTAYLKANGIQVDQVAAYRLGELKVPGTPFLMLVDGNGTVTRVWRGWLPPPQETEVLKVLGLT